jgi:DNA-binding Xre family transcriptional regulator
MLKYNFERVFKARGIDRPFAYLKRAGFSDSLASKLKNSKVSRLNLDLIERLCLALRCSPNDFMEWQPDKDSTVDNDHPLNVIRRNDKVIDITKTLNSIPLGKLDEVDEILKKYVTINP